MELDVGIGKETMADVRSTSMFQRALRPAHEARLHYMTAPEQAAVRREGAVIVGLSGLFALITDLRMHRGAHDNRRSASVHWSPRARGWVLS